MSMWTLLVALVCALIVWAVLVRYLMAQPWLPAGDPGNLDDITAVDQPAKKVGLYFFLGAISSLFILFITAYLMRMDPNHGADWYSIPKPGILWINTLLLLYSSISMQHAKAVAAQPGQKISGAHCLLAACLPSCLSQASYGPGRLYMVRYIFSCPIRH